MKGSFVIKQLVAGPRFALMVDTVFPRNTAAYAFLITRLEARGVRAIIKDDDPDNPGCMDIMADFGGALEQYAIEVA